MNRCCIIVKFPFWIGWTDLNIELELFSVDLQKKFLKKICNQKKIIVIGLEGQIDALPWITKGYIENT